MTQAEKANKPDKEKDKAEKPDKSQAEKAKADKSEKPEPEKPDKSEKREKSEKASTAEKPSKTEKADSDKAGTLLWRLPHATPCRLSRQRRQSLIRTESAILLWAMLWIGIPVSFSFLHCDGRLRSRTKQARQTRRRRLPSGMSVHTSMTQIAVLECYAVLQSKSKKTKDDKSEKKGALPGSLPLRQTKPFVAILAGAEEREKASKSQSKKKALETNRNFACQPSAQHLQSAGLDGAWRCDVPGSSGQSRCQEKTAKGEAIKLSTAHASCIWYIMLNLGKERQAIL